MSSSDINMSELKLMLENHLSANSVQISEMKAAISEMKKDNAEFRLQVNKDFQAFTERTESRLGELQTEIQQVNMKLTGLEHDVAGLYHWDYWLLSLIIASMVMPQLGEIMKTLITGISEGIAGIVSLFRSGKPK